MQNPVFILGAHKSGSSLLRSLLDGIPGTFVLPFEAHIFQYAGFWTDYALRRARPPLLPFAEVRAAYTRNVENYNSLTDDLSDANLIGRFDVRSFSDALNTYPAASFKELIEGYFRASYISLFQQTPPENIRYIEKSVEQAEFALDLKKMFPNAKFIHILRNPYSNMVALRRHVGRKQFPFLGSIARSLYNSYYHLYRNCRLLDDYLVLRYEDLLTDTRGSMEKVAAFLEIPFSEDLLVPTSLGEQWSGNSSRGLKFSGVSAKNLDLWKKDITNFEIYLVNRFFSFVIDEYHYEPLSLVKSQLWPEKHERPGAYARNRLIQEFLR